MINGGAVAIGADNNLGTSSSAITLNTGTLSATASISAFTHTINTGSTSGRDDQRGFGPAIANQQLRCKQRAHHRQRGNHGHGRRSAFGESPTN